jgi:outer membrane protein
MKHPLLLFGIAASMWGSDLSTLLSDTRNNLRIESARLEIEKSQSLLDEAKSSYFPTITAAGVYQRKDKATAFEPKSIHGIEVGAEVDVFDGFRREALLRALRANKEGMFQSLEQERQNVLMETIAAYYDYLDVRMRLEAISEKKKELDAQVKRFEILVRNDLSTRDVLTSLNASRSGVEYDEQHLQTLLEKHRKDLELLSGSVVVEPIEFQPLRDLSAGAMTRRDLQSDRAAIEILKHTQERYTYLPTLSVGARHKTYAYDDYDTMGGINVQPKNQNEVTAKVSMTLFDMGRISQEREQARIDTLKAQKMLDYKTRKLRNDADIAFLNIQSAHNALRAARAEEEARHDAFVTIKTRFEAGLLNTTDYLSELTALTDARAKAHHAQNALQVAKAHAAYALGTDLMTLIEEKQ